MKVPKYVQDLMERSEYEFDRFTKHENYGAGYTIRIGKSTEYGYAETLRKEVERLCRWANRVAGVETAYILNVPAKTHYCKQWATVTIFDPVMQKIEQYIPERRCV